MRDLELHEFRTFEDVLIDGEEIPVNVFDVEPEIGDTYDGQEIGYISYIKPDEPKQYKGYTFMEVTFIDSDGWESNPYIIAFEE